jgi:hypothetical protein
VFSIENNRIELQRRLNEHNTKSAFLDSNTISARIAKYIKEIDE